MHCGKCSFYFLKMFWMHPTVSSIQFISPWDEIALIFRGLGIGVWAFSVLKGRERHLRRMVKSPMTTEKAMIPTLLWSLCFPYIFNCLLFTLWQSHTSFSFLPNWKSEFFRLIFPSCVLLGIFTSTIQDCRTSEFYMYKTPWMPIPKFFLIQISFLMMALWLCEVSETAVPAE